MAFRPPSATQTLTASGAALAWGSLVLVNSATAVTVTLPSALASKLDLPLEIKNLGAGLVTVVPFGTNTITGSTALVQGSVVVYEVSAAGVVQALGDMAATITTALEYARVAVFQTGSTAVNANSLAQILCVSAANVAATLAPIGQRVPFTAANGTASGAVIGTNIITVATTGSYSIDSAVSMQTQGANTAMGIQLVKNGVVLNYMQGYPGVGSAMLTVPVEWSGPLLTGDVIDLRVVSTSLVSTINVHSVSLNVNQMAGASVVPVGSVVPTALANGSAFVTSSVPIAATTPAASVVAVSVTLPNIGTYEIHTRIRGGVTAATSEALESALFLSPSSTTFNTAGGGTMVVNSEVLALFSSSLNAGSVQATGSGVAIVTTTVANTVVNMQVWASGTGADLVSDTNGRSGLVYIQLPTSTVVDPGLIVPTSLTFAEVIQTADQTTGLTVGSPILFSTPAVVGSLPFVAGVFTLAAGTYSLLGGVTLITGTELIFQWRNITTGLLIGGAGNVHTVTSGRGVTASATVVATATTTVRLEITNVNALTAINVGSSTGRGAWAKILQLPIATVVNPGTVPVQTLHRSSVSRNSVTNTVVTGTTWTTAYASMMVLPLMAGSDRTVDPDLLISGNTWVVKQAGRYQLSGFLSIEYGDACAISVGKNNTEFARYSSDPVAASPQAGGLCGIDVDFGQLAVGDIIDIRAVGHSGTVRYFSYSATLAQQATATVFQVTPGTLTAVTLGYASASSPSYVPTAVGDVPFTVVDAGGISYTGTTFTLLAGKRYYMDARLSFNSNTGTASQIGYQVVRADNTAISGVSSGLWMNQVAQATGGGESPGSTGFFTPTVDTLVKVRVISTSGPVAGATTSGVFLIQEQAVTSLVNPSAVPVAALATGSAFATASAVITASTPAASIVAASVTLPNIGRYQIHTTVRGASPGSTNAALHSAVFLNPSSTVFNTAGGGVLVSDSEVMTLSSSASTPGGMQVTGSGLAIVTTTTVNTVVNMQVWAAVGSMTLASDVNGRSGLVYVQLPASTVIVPGSIAAATAASDAAAGTAGYAPASPVAGDNRKALFGDMTFKAVPMQYAAASAYASGDLAYLGDELVRANAAVPAGTTFAWGTTGTTWSPVLSIQSTDNLLVWNGVYAAGTSYGKGDVVSATSANTAALLVSQQAANLGNSLASGWWQSMHDGSIDHAMVGATLALAGTPGAMPAPAAGQQDFVARGDGTWDLQGRKSQVQIASMLVNGAIGTAALTVDVADELVFTQNLGGIIATIPSLTVTTKYRTLTLQNKGTAAIVISATGFTKTLPVGGTLVAEWNGTAAWSLVACTPQAPVVQTFTANGTYTPTPGMVYCIAKVVGGGAGGGGAGAGAATTLAMGFGGGAGGQAEAMLTAAQVGASQAVTIGGSGAGGVGSVAGSGGGPTSLGALISCGGGFGGPITGAQVGPHAFMGGGGGSATVTTGTPVVVRVGSDGAIGFGMYYATTTLISVSPSYGGDSWFGPGGRSVAIFATGGTASGGNGLVGGGPGAGGGGATSGGTGSVARTGGPGAPGRIVITEFF